MTWYTFKDWIWTSGPQKGKLKIYNVTGIDNIELEATGAHGYPTEKDSLQKPNAFPSVAQEALLAMFSAQAAYPIGGGVGGAQTPTPSATAGAKDAIKKLGTGTIDDLINWLTQGSLWTRVGEFAIGGILLYVGLKAAVSPSGQDVGKRTFKQTVKTVAKKVR